ncbi:MAG: FAD/NAD(P)-binding protein [Candidatus Omnitrophica bacterium]|nr:FAD/NAD(P)-binding protein [Candidatus Omnitrophota bacterium]
MENPYKFIEAEIIDVKDETPTIKTFVLKPKERISFKTGEFMEVAIPGFGEGPFTPSSNPKDDTKLEFTIMDVGRVTGALHRMKTGGVVGLRGPYGKGYPLGEFKGKEILIVGGGVGLAPIRSLIYALFNQLDNYKKIYLKYGAKTPPDIMYKDEVDRWSKDGRSDVKLTVDAGDAKWKGNVGLVTTILEDLKIDLNKSVSVVCGPPIMMKFVTFKLLEIGYKPEDIYLSMEKNMSCGIGKCGHCRIGNSYACKDGPVFSYKTIKDYPNIWD